MSDGGGTWLPLSSKANQLPNELSTVRCRKSWNFLPSSSNCVRSSEANHASRSETFSKRYIAVHSSCVPSTGRNSSVPRETGHLLSANRRRSCHARNSSMSSDSTRWVTTTVTSWSVALGAPPIICWVGVPSKYWLPIASSACRVELSSQACRLATESKRYITTHAEC